MKIRKLMPFLLFICSISAFAQQGIKGKVSGDKNQAISACEIFIENTDYSVETDLQGNYQLEVPPGEYTITISGSGYATTAQPVKIEADHFSELNFKLQKTSQEKQIKEVVVTGSQTKNEANLITIQKKSVEIVENVSSAQLQKQGVGDVSSAVTKATGTLKQEGSGVIFIRGLGDRYNFTSLNGLPIPSNNPEYKNIDLSLFKTDIVEYISLEKVFSPKMYGDVGGANINIISKEHQGKAFFKIGMSSSINTQTISQDKFWQKDGTNFYGFRNNKMPEKPLSGYRFNTSWDWRNVDNPFSSGLSLETGNSFNVGNEGKISFLAYASFDNEYNYSKGVENSINAQGFHLKSLASQRYQYITNTTGMANLSYKINSKNKISYNFLFINSSDQTNRLMQGYIKDLAEDNTGMIRRAEYKKSDLWTHQLLGKHELSNSFILNWAGAYNLLKSKNPDRQQNTLKLDTNNNYIFVSNSDSDQNRYFDELKDDEIAGNLSLDYLFGREKIHKLTIGYQGKRKERTFEATQINFQINQASTLVDMDDIDAFFTQTNYNKDLFSMKTFRGNKYIKNALLPSKFNGTQFIQGAYANLSYKLSENWIAQIGARVEFIDQKINWDTNLSASKKDQKLDKTKFLPSLNLKYALNDRNNLRLALSKTYTLPQFKEIAPFYYEDITEISFGNPYVYPSDNYNVDLKWEFFPKPGEVLSITAFGKYIKNPIAKLTVASSANEVSYANVGDWAYVYGAEIEVRKNIYEWSGGKLYTFLNGTFMQTQSELNNEKVYKETKGFINPSFDKDQDDLQGAAKFLANVNLGYTQKLNGRSELDFVVSYAYIGKNIYSLSYNKTGNLIDNELNILDANLSFNFNKKVSLKFYAKNILNPEYERKQETLIGDLTQKSYDRGRSFGAGFSYQF